MGKFELELVVRDAKGNPTKTKKKIVADSGDEISSFWSRYQGKKKFKKKNKEKLPTAKEAEQIAKTVGNYAEEKQQDRDKTTE